MTPGELAERERTGAGLGEATWSTDRKPPPNNQLLSSLPPEVADVLQSRSEAVDLAAGTILYEADTILVLLC